MNKSECRWIASRWQLGDCLTKPGLGKSLREILNKSATRLHELSLAEVKKKKNTAKVNDVHFLIWNSKSSDDSDVFSEYIQTFSLNHKILNQGKCLERDHQM
jgi:hypothetical protein